MADRYQRLSSTPPGRFLVGRLGLPDRTAAAPLRAGPAAARRPGARRRRRPASPAHHGRAGPRTRRSRRRRRPTTAPHAGRRVVFDATGIAASEDLARAARLLLARDHAAWPASGRVLVLGTPPEQAADRRHAVAQRALEGFVRSARQGAAPRRDRPARLRRARRRGRPRVDAALPALLQVGLRRRARSSASAPGASPAPEDWEQPAGRPDRRGHRRRRAASARRSPQTLARDGAHVVCLDSPAAGRGPRAGRQRDRRHRARARRHRRRRARDARRPPAGAPRRRRHRRPQRRHHPRPHARAA